MAWKPVSTVWPSNRAMLLVHGIGDPQATYYDPVVAALKAVPDVDWDSFAIYPFRYETINEWFNEKTQLGSHLDTLKNRLGVEIGKGDLGARIADSVGDVIWPVLSSSAREAARAAYIAQLDRLVEDGKDRVGPVRKLRISVICHSLGCFHTYEALHSAATVPSYGLQPYSSRVKFKNVIFMASPVQLIRTVASLLGPLVPDRTRLATLWESGLGQPGETNWRGKWIKSVENWVSITGDLDPVGGFFAREKADWAYMDVEDQVSRVDKQQLLATQSVGRLVATLAESAAEGAPPRLLNESPHSWTGYIERHTEDLKEWL
jgi:hypothetical protein